MIPFNDSRRQFEALREPIEAAALGVLRSGWYVHGEEHKAFEAEFAESVGVKHCLGVANGTDALEIALRAVGCGPADEVVTVANAGFYASTATLRVGAVPRFVDVRPEDHLMDVDLLPEVLGERTRAVVVTHLYGRLAQVERVVDLCSSRGISVVEDCAQAVGAQRDGRRAGSFGDIAAFSFYPTKNLGGMGDGGALSTNSDDIAARVRRLRQYGWTDKYTVQDAGGRNSRLDELQAAVLRVKLPFVDGWNAKRREIVGRYREALQGESTVRMIGSPAGDDVAHLAVAVAQNRSMFQATLSAAGVSTAIHYPLADHQQPLFASRLSQRHLPVTDATQSKILTLPCYPELAEGEIKQICTALAAAKAGEPRRG